MHIIPYKARMTYYRLLRKVRSVYDPKPERLQSVVGVAGELFPVFSPLPRNVKWQRDDRCGIYCEKISSEGSRKGRAITMMFLHGGAFVFGSPKTHRHMVGWLSREIGCDAIVPDYRLSPKHPYPAALDDVEAVYKCLREERPNDQIIVAGDSAGGNLSLALVHRLQRTDFPLPDRLLLFSPWIDLRDDSAASTENREQDSLFNREDMRQYSRLYRHGHAADDPEVSPGLGGVKGFPPVFIQAAANEFLFPDYPVWVEELKANNQTVEFDVVERAFHSWQLFPGYSPQARNSLKKAAQFARQSESAQLNA